MSSSTRLDVRIPIGAFFAIAGAMLVIFGLVSDKEIYKRSENININFWWGLVMLIFGAIFLLTALHSANVEKKKAGSDESKAI